MAAAVKAVVSRVLPSRLLPQVVGAAGRAAVVGVSAPATSAAVVTRPTGQDHLLRAWIQLGSAPARGFASSSWPAGHPPSAGSSSVRTVLCGRRPPLPACCYRYPALTARGNATVAAMPGGAAAAAGRSGLAMSPLVAGLSDSARRQLATWLGLASGWVAALVVIGGVTRLTRSGLSMTEWKFTGEAPPLTDEDWQVEFRKYQDSPEFRQVHSSMTLDEFKFIFWMEYGHRMWARVLGLLFAGPAAVFAARGFINAPLARRLGLLFLMGGTQGLVGWWMVRSGLRDPKESDNPHAAPRVSPYRLAGHLASAFAIYTTLVWTTLSVASPTPLLASFQEQPKVLQAALKLRRLAHPLAALIGVTALSGAFVAGNDAGRAYNTFPTMNGQWVPEEYFEAPHGWLRSCFENTAAVQLHHRVLALTTASSVLALWMHGSRLPLPPATKTALHLLLAGTALQVTLGVSTLLTYVPVSLGSAHQAGALGLFTVVLGLMHSLRKPTLRAGAPAMLYPALLAGVAGVGAAVTQQQ
eukprot:jgi/Tetstr1/442793/TSEL_030877.t1